MMEILLRGLAGLLRGLTTGLNFLVFLLR